MVGLIGISTFLLLKPVFETNLLRPQRFLVDNHVKRILSEWVNLELLESMPS